MNVTRPVVFLSSLYCAGIVAAQQIGASSTVELTGGLGPNPAWQVVLLGSLGVLAVAAGIRRKTPPLALIGALAFGAGYAGATCALERTRLPLGQSGAYAQVVARVTASGVSRESTFTIRVSSGALPDGTSLDGKAFVVSQPKESTGIPCPGETVAIKGKVIVAEEPGNPGEFDYGLYLRARGLAGQIRAIECRTIAGPRLSLATVVHRTRLKIARVVHKALPRDEAAFLTGILLGETRGLPEDVLAEFRDTGIYHVLAVSGLHVHFVLGPLSLVFRRVGKPWARVAVQALALMLYSMLTGMQPSVIRSAIMAVLPAIALSTGRRRDGLDSLCTACSTILVFSPLALFDPGLQLSALATAGLVLLSRRTLRLLDWLPVTVASPLASTLAAQVLTVPALAGRSALSLHSLVANPLVVPIVGVALCWGMAGSLVLLVLDKTVLAPYVLLPAGALVRLATDLAAMIARAPGGRVRLPGFGLLQAAGYFVTCLLLFRVWRPRFFASPRCRSWGNVLIIVLITIVAWLPAMSLGPRDALRLTFLDVGQGDCILLEPPGGVPLLVDCGTDAAAQRRILPALFSKGIRTIEALVVTHLHSDHAGGTNAVRSSLDVGRVLSGVQWDRSREELDLVEMGAKVAAIIQDGWSLTGDRRGGHGVPAGSVRVEAVWPADDALNPERSENERSVVLTVRYGCFTAVLTGDAGAATERALLSRAELSLRCHVLKVGHHGSKYATTPAFVAAADPMVAVVSVGPNIFGHPSKELIQRLTERGASVLRTDRDGAVTVVTDGRRLKVLTQRKRTPGPGGE